MEKIEPFVLDAGFMADRHALYAELREHLPVVQVVTPLGLTAWLVTRHDDVQADPRLSKDGSAYSARREQGARAPEGREAFLTPLVRHMLNTDPPDHTRLRRLVGRAFTGRAVAGLRPRITGIAAELADRMADAAAEGYEVDLLDAFAHPLPITVICELLGVPEGDRQDFRRWSGALAATAGSPQERQAAAPDMAEYLHGLVDATRADPGDDLLSALVSGPEDDRLSREETVSMAYLLLVAGHETTANLIGNGALVLLREPARLAQLRADADLVPAAVEEFLRLEAEIAFRTLLARFPGMAAARDPASLRWRPSTVVRGLTALPVRLGAPA